MLGAGGYSRLRFCPRLAVESNPLEETRAPDSELERKAQNARVSVGRALPPPRRDGRRPCQLGSSPDGVRAPRAREQGRRRHLRAGAPVGVVRREAVLGLRDRQLPHQARRDGGQPVEALPRHQGGGQVALVLLGRRGQRRHHRLLRRVRQALSPSRESTSRTRAARVGPTRSSASSRRRTVS